MPTKKKKFKKIQTFRRPYRSRNVCAIFKVFLVDVLLSYFDSCAVHLYPLASGQEMLQLHCRESWVWCKLLLCILILCKGFDAVRSSCPPICHKLVCTLEHSLMSHCCPTHGCTFSEQHCASLLVHVCCCLCASSPLVKSMHNKQFSPTLG